MEELNEKTLDLIFGALANSTRRAMLARLAKGEATVTQLAEPFELSMPAISRHIRVLEEAGLISQGQDAQYRPCSLDVAPLKEISNWADKYRNLWQARFDQMDTYIEQLERRENENE